jgi:acyl-coenzyme A synthetase/AMP-(fatty) acid ligase
MISPLLDVRDYPTALRTFEWKALWGLVDGTADQLNLAHEAVLMSHPDVREAAVIAVADELRGQVAKAFVVVARPGGVALVTELQAWVRERLSHHEYPRAIEIVDELPKTPAVKINRQVLRERGVAPS